MTAIHLRDKRVPRLRRSHQPLARCLHLALDQSLIAVPVVGRSGTPALQTVDLLWAATPSYRLQPSGTSAEAYREGGHVSAQDADGRRSGLPGQEHGVKVVGAPALQLGDVPF